MIFLSETTRPRVLIFDMQHHLVDLYQVCSNNAPGGKNYKDSGERSRAHGPFCS